MRAPFALTLLVLLAGALPRAASAQLPEDRRTLTRTVSYTEMEAFLASVSGRGPITTSVEARGGAAGPARRPPVAERPGRRTLNAAY